MLILPSNLLKIHSNYILPNVKAKFMDMISMMIWFQRNILTKSTFIVHIEYNSDTNNYLIPCSKVYYFVVIYFCYIQDSWKIIKQNVFYDVLL